MGFGIPLSNLIAKSLNKRIDYFINSSEFKNQNLFDLNQYKIRWDEHSSGKRNWQFLIWNFFVFQLWYENWNKSKV